MKKLTWVLIAALLSGCATPEDRQKWAAAAAIVAVAAIAYSATRSDGGGGYAPAAVDYEWDWDQFYHQGTLIWACRGVQTGQFAERSNCQYKYQSDYRWPNK